MKKIVLGVVVGWLLSRVAIHQRYEMYMRIGQRYGVDSWQERVAGTIL